MKINSTFLVCSILIGSFWTTSSHAAVLLTHAGGLVSESTLVVSTVGSIVMNDTSSGTVYFCFTVTNPASGGLAGENSFAAFELQNGGSSTVGVGNNWNAWAYSVFGNTGEFDLKSSTPEPAAVYQLIRPTDTTTIALAVDYTPSGNDTLTIWLNPDFGLTPGAQTSNRTTVFTGDFSFTSLQLREGGAGDGWNFSNIQVAATPSEIGFVPEPSSALLSGFGLLALLRRRRGQSQAVSFD